MYVDRTPTPSGPVKKWFTRLSIWIITFFGVLAVLALIFVVTLMPERSTKEKVQEKLPDNAKNIVDEGEGWYSFELHGSQFLYHKENQELEKIGDR